MNISSYSFSRFVGIDVSKGTLDIASAECQSTTIGNTRKEINQQFPAGNFEWLYSSQFDIV